MWQRSQLESKSDGMRSGDARGAADGGKTGSPRLHSKHGASSPRMGESAYAAGRLTQTSKPITCSSRMTHPTTTKRTRFPSSIFVRLSSRTTPTGSATTRWNGRKVNDMDEAGEASACSCRRPSCYGPSRFDASLRLLQHKASTMVSGVFSSHADKKKSDGCQSDAWPLPLPSNKKSAGNADDLRPATCIQKMAELTQIYQ